ncbi:MAG: hypothetical protein ACREN5_07060 [Gemmatimonadales bacterium]
MRKLIGSALLAVALVAVPSAANAQQHEFGVDLGIAYEKPSGFDGTFNIFTPVDVRIGWMSASKMMIETRLNFGFESGGGATNYAIAPEVRLLWALGGTHKAGTYAGVGAEVILVGNGTSGAAFSFGGGIGRRKAMGTAALRTELFLAYTLESVDLGIPNTLTIGANVGLSLWH